MWLAALLLAQFQTGVRIATITSIDEKLAEFKKITRKDGAKAKGFAGNPLVCVDFSGLERSWV